MNIRESSPVWTFDPLAVPPGAVAQVEWVFASVADLPPAVLPTIVIAGTQPGKTAVLVAGIHGDEYEGIAALWTLAETLKPNDISGRIILLPIAHTAAFGAGTRTSPVDDVNLARVFPGDPDGTITHRLAAHLFTRIVTHADLLIDCHSGGSRLVFVPVSGFYQAGGDIAAQAAEASFRAACYMSLPYLWSLPHRSGVLSYEAARRGIAVTGCEIGGRGGRLESDSCLYVEGIRRVLQAWGILAGTPGEQPAYPTYLDGDWQLAPVAGFLENHVQLGQSVSAGASIAAIRGAFGESLVVMTAPTDGVVMGLRHLCSIGSGEWATCVVQERPL
jgi:predicted deacylase